MVAQESKTPPPTEAAVISSWLAWLGRAVTRHAARHRALAARASAAVGGPPIRSRVALALTGVDVLSERRRAAEALSLHHRAEARRGEAALAELRIAAEVVAASEREGWINPLPDVVTASIRVLSRLTKGGKAPEDPAAEAAAIGAAIRAWADRTAGGRAVADEAREAINEARREAEQARERGQGLWWDAVSRGPFGEREPHRAALFLLGIPGTGRMPLFASPPPITNGSRDKDDALRDVATRGAQELLRAIGGRGAHEHRGIQPYGWMEDRAKPVPLTASRRLALAARSASRNPNIPHDVNLTGEGERLFVSRAYLDRFGDALARVLPLCATRPGRLALANLPFVPVPRSASRKNIRNLFQPDYWNTLSKNAATLRGDLCCVCGSPVGTLAVGGWPEPRQGPIDVHEAWTWNVVDATRRIGIQRLVSLLPVCSDCHKVFHVDQAEWDAATHARMFGGDRDELCGLAVNFFVDRRAGMLSETYPFPHQEAAARMAEESRASRELSDAVDRWIVDLSSLRLLDLAGGPPVFGFAQEHFYEPYDICGIEFRLLDGRVQPALSMGQSLQMVSAELDRKAAAAPLAEAEPVHGMTR